VRNHDLNRLLDEPGSKRNGTILLKISFYTAAPAKAIGLTQSKRGDD
jgi:hypothetical protein